ncbi:MAG: hypothetical protein AUI33_12175 [Ignavibacteria bacterium 13_1_40CM_2_61_4]|nr:MAG: hypothetical protein AUI33_12175 [Ignavibacteria bacterium 13_1_40CM_2_61_4]
MPTRSRPTASAPLGALVALLLLPLVAAAQRPPAKELDRYVAQALRDFAAPGLALAIVKDDSVVYAKGYGVRELGKPAPVTERTLFAIGSTTKAFTAALLGMLVDEGKLRWDDPVTKYLPGFQLYDPWVTRELTVRDLLTHRSGLERGDLLWWASPYDRAEVLRRIRFLKAKWSFRATYGYQNIMFLAAGQVAAAAAGGGTSWDDLMRDRILRPLGMTATTTSVTTLPVAGDVATPYELIDGRMTAVAWRNIDNIGPAGAINSSAREMAQWMRLQLGHGLYRGQRLLSTATVDEMQASQIVVPRDTVRQRLYPSEHFLSYGLGWVLRDYRGRKVVEHNGAIDGMRAIVALVPEERLGVVVLTNFPRGLLNAGVAYRVIDAYLGAPPRDWSGLFLELTRRFEQRADSARQKRAADRARDTQPSLALERYTGVYADTMYGSITVVMEGGHLVLKFGPNLTGDLEHWQHDTFRCVWRDRTAGDDFMTFTLDAQGRPAKLEYEELTAFVRTP